MVFNDALYNPQTLLVEAESLLRDMPPITTLHHSTMETFGWFGRAAALIEAWNPAKAVAVSAIMAQFNTLPARASITGGFGMVSLVQQARSDLMLRTAGPVSGVFVEGMVFSYFDEIAKIIETAIQDVLFIDPYMDAEFVRRFLPSIRSGVPIRLLTGDKERYLAQLQPAAQLFATQYDCTIEIRSHSGLHDRYVFIDRAACYQSGASFKDGAKNAPTTVTQIVDAFTPVQQMYSEMWDHASKLS